MNCMIAQSGGPTVAINASLAGVINAWNREDGRIYGAVNGILGVLHEQFLDLTEKEASVPDFTDRLMHTPAMYLGSCRYRIPAGAEGEAEYEKIFSIFHRMEIGAFFYIGGNDSMDTVMKLSAYGEAHHEPTRIIGIPKTIDNDLMVTDHTPGFGSAAKYVATTVREVAADAYIYAIKSVTIVEIMGRDAGWLTAAAALARAPHSPAPDRIYLPEVPFSIEDCIHDTEELLQKKNAVVIAVSEGIRDKDGAYISTADAGSDNFGHNHLSGAGKTLEHILKDRLGVKVRSIEINVLQRCAAHLSSATDLRESEALGEKAFSLAREGRTGVMAILRRTGNDPYASETDAADVREVANLIKKVPVSWITEAGNDVTSEMTDYLAPLIQGEAKVRYKDGLPEYLPVSHLSGE